MCLTLMLPNSRHNHYFAVEVASILAYGALHFCGASLTNYFTVLHPAVDVSSAHSFTVLNLPRYHQHIDSLPHPHQRINSLCLTLLKWLPYQQIHILHTLLRRHHQHMHSLHSSGRKASSEHSSCFPYSTVSPKPHN